MESQPSKKELHDRFVGQIHAAQGILHRVCAVYSRTREERQDLWQEILLQLWRAFPAFRGHSSFSTWMYRVALNTALMHRRSRSRAYPTIPIEDITLPATAGPGVETQEGVRLLYDSIRGLDPLDRAVILLRLEEKSYGEIAEVTGLSEGNVSVRLVRAKEKLKQAMLARGYTGGGHVGR